MAAKTNYEQAGELKIGQVGIANLRIRTLDVARLAQEMAERVQGAPKLFERAAVILDFGGLSECPDAATVNALVDGLRAAGVLPVAIAYGTRDIEPVSEPKPRPKAAEDKPAAAPTSAAGDVGMVQLSPVRSGQQLYAKSRDLTVCASVGAGAEVIADGSIHIYGALRGRALAGAGGNTAARIFCREFNAELVAVAGTYKVLEEIPKELLGKPVQIWLENDSLRIEAQP